MAVSEQARRRLYDYLEAQMGEELAATLMNSLPPAGWGDVATKQDLDNLHVLMRSDLIALAHQLRGETAEHVGALREEMAQMKGELREEMAQMKGELRTEIADLRGEMHRELRLHLVAMISTNAAMGGLLLAAVKLF
ncbi:MAG TPA: hypothetical protein VM938_01430 [Acidimicrobiales bacterium]|nr:hypothetical protein [Acidimicrobiales bacterium]